MKRKNRYASEKKVLLIPPEEIRCSPDQMRREFDREKLLELAVSIAENGLLQPISVAFENGQPVLVAGERRLRAARMVGLQKIPAIEVTAQGASRAVLTLLENVQRQDIHPFEEAQGIFRLIEMYGLTQGEVAARLGWTQSTVANKLRLLKLPEGIREQLVRNGMTERHARALLRLPEEKQQAAVDRMIAGHYTVAQTERLVEGWLTDGKKRRRPMLLVRDVRVFLNTFDHAVDTMLRSGVPATAERNETDEYYELTVRIPKKKNAEEKAG